MTTREALAAKLEKEYHRAAWQTSNAAWWSVADTALAWMLEQVPDKRGAGSANSDRLRWRVEGHNECRAEMLRRLGVE